VIQLRHGQLSLWHSGLAKDIEDHWEPWMKEVDGLLEDAVLLEAVYQAQGKRRRHSRRRGRMQTPAEVALRLLILKHVRNWEGTVDVFYEDSPDKYTAMQRIPTHAGSKTMALNSKTHELLVPSNESGTFQILLFGN
jgi:hypothetical protein